MDRIKKLVGGNLQSIRKQRHMTLQELSELTGVSKSMLGEIERGVTSPTITVLWKIADGLKMPFTQFIQDESPEFTLVRKDEMDSFNEGGVFTISSIFRYDPNKKFEIFHICLAPQSTHDSRGHNKGVGEYTLVYEGVMTIDTKGTQFALSPGDSLYIKGDARHSYINHGDCVAKAYSIISYDNGDTIGMD